MLSASFFIAPKDLWSLVGTGAAIQAIDTRRRDVYDTSAGLVPTAWLRLAASERHNWPAPISGLPEIGMYYVQVG